MKASLKSGLFTLGIGLMLASSPTGLRAAPESTPAKTELATFGGGCFWCMEAVFERINGVKAVTSGYAGGKTANPSYKEVCSGDTGHAEVIQVEFEPQTISYNQLLEVFWEVHNPTTLNRQGADSGEQYRSVILYHNEAQKKAAEESKKVASANFKQPIVTQIVPLGKFYAAEEYHQDYFRKNPHAPYCSVVISPKVQKLEKQKKFKLQAPKL
jgi:peptide-methionine (S)-S-oxide reductase